MSRLPALSQISEYSKACCHHQTDHLPEVKLTLKIAALKQIMRIASRTNHTSICQVGSSQQQ